jgi:hypothetical protein
VFEGSRPIYLSVVFEYGAWEEASDKRHHSKVQLWATLVSVYCLFFRGLGHFSFDLCLSMGPGKRQGLILECRFWHD